MEPLNFLAVRSGHGRDVARPSSSIKIGTLDATPGVYSCTDPLVLRT